MLKKQLNYKGLVRPVLEYGSSLWDPHTKCLQEELEKVQNRAARFVTRNYTFEEGSNDRYDYIYSERNVPFAKGRFYFKILNSFTIIVHILSFIGVKEIGNSFCMTFTSL